MPIHHVMCTTGKISSSNVGEVVLSDLPAWLWTENTQAYICMDCGRGNSVSDLGVGGKGLWKEIIVAHTLSGLQLFLVCPATCI